MFRLMKSERGNVLLEIFVVLTVVVVLGLFLMRTLVSSITGTADENSMATTEKQQLTDFSGESIMVLFIALGVIVGLFILIFFAISLINLLSERNKTQPQSLDDVLRLMIRKKPKKLFTLVKGTAEEYVYHYDITKYQWVLTVNEVVLDIQMKRNKKTVLHVTYNQKETTFTRRNVSATLFAEKKTIKKLDKLLRSILATEWRTHDHYQLVGATENINEALPTPRGANLHPMQSLETQVESIIEDAVLKTIFQSVLASMHALLDQHEALLDIETKHIIHYSLTNDLTRLLALYEDLNDNQKEVLAEEIQKRLHAMNEKVQAIQTKIDEKKVQEIKKVLHVLDTRYRP